VYIQYVTIFDTQDFLKVVVTRTRAILVSPTSSTCNTKILVLT